VLAALTGIPNLYTAIRLALRGKGGAVVTEAMNSNLLNIVVGLALPAVIFAGVGVARAGVSDSVWLLALTAGAIALAAARNGLKRFESPLHSALW
jgi:Ca2+/Na+ antiporter